MLILIATARTAQRIQFVLQGKYLEGCRLATLLWCSVRDETRKFWSPLPSAVFRFPRPLPTHCRRVPAINYPNFQNEFPSIIYSIRVCNVFANHFQLLPNNKTLRWDLSKTTQQILSVLYIKVIQNFGILHRTAGQGTLAVSGSQAEMLAVYLTEEWRLRE